jgi:hypothetical protein
MQEANSICWIIKLKISFVISVSFRRKKRIQHPLCNFKMINYDCLNQLWDQFLPPSLILQRHFLRKRKSYSDSDIIASPRTASSSVLHHPSPPQN